MRVKVWRYINQQNPDEGYIGEGEFVGHAPISEVITKEQYKKSFKEFFRSVLKQMGMPHEGVIFEQTFEKHWTRKYEDFPFEEHTTPKIVLDSGEIVYGFQVWWNPIEEDDKNAGNR